MPFNLNVPDANNTVGQDLIDLKESINYLGGERIVEHNLDVASPANGYYVRWENGLQVCFYITNSITDYSIEYTQNFGASFNETPVVLTSFDRNGGFSGATVMEKGVTSLDFIYKVSWISTEPSDGGEMHWVAIGRWQ